MPPEGREYGFRDMQKSQIEAWIERLKNFEEVFKNLDGKIIITEQERDDLIEEGYNIALEPDNEKS